MTIGIIESDFHGRHSSSWTQTWIDVCEAMGAPCEVIDWRSRGALAAMMRHDIVLWHFSHYSSGEMRFARSYLRVLADSGRRVFPSERDAWHFDDKVAQALLLDAIGAPIPEYEALFSMAAVEEWLAAGPAFPVVAKLRGGSGATNVKLVPDAAALRSYARKMFGRGFVATPKPMFKAVSNLRSSRSLSDLRARLRRAPEFFFSLASARRLPREQGYVLVQEFIPGAQYDIKVVVIGDRLSFIGRRIRTGDFRASGGGDLFFDRSIMTPEVISAAFRTADQLETTCIGMDFVVDPRSGNPYIVEISYGFSHSALLDAGGYFDRTSIWHDEPLDAPRYVLERLIAEGGVA